MMSLPDQIKTDSVKKIINIANRIIRNEINVVEGSREIVKLRYNTNAHDDRIFDPFIAVDSDTDHIPLDENIRKNFGSDYLKKSDKELREYIKEMKPSIISDCHAIIKKFSN